MLIPIDQWFQVHRPVPDTRRPVLVHVPHAGKFIIPAIRDGFVASPEEVDDDLARSTDHAVDQLWLPAIERGATMAVNGISRLMCDVERHADDAKESAAATGRGVVYTHTCHGRPLREPLSPLERHVLVGAVHGQWHDLVADEIDALLEDFRTVTIIDAHSFPDEPLAIETDPMPGERPDICLGWDDDHTPESYRQPLVDLFESRGLSVQENRPFAGALVPARHWRKNPKLRSLMIEVNRRLYWDEEAGELDHARAEDLQEVLMEAYVLVESLTQPVRRIKMRSYTEEDYRRLGHSSIGTLYRAPRRPPGDDPEKQ